MPSRLRPRQSQRVAAITAAACLVAGSALTAASPVVALAASSSPVLVSAPAVPTKPAVKKATARTLAVKAKFGTIVRGKRDRIYVTFKKGKTRIPASVVRLQIREGGVWKNTKTLIRITNGKGSLVVSPTKTTRYRVKRGTLFSKAVRITVTKPAPKAAKLTAARAFRINGSGFGHGVGMSQYGAYQMAREGSSATNILQHYYQGTKVTSTSVPARISVQVFGPEPYSFRGYADSANSTTFSVNKGRWRVVDSEGIQLFPTSGTATSAASLKLSVSGTRVRADVVGSPSLTPRKLTQPGLILQWSGTDAMPSPTTAAVASVSGAHGQYRHGLLRVSNIGGRLNIVNNLPLTNYLYGIAEMPSGWGTASAGGSAALSAQAITARSYALVKMKVTASRPQGRLKAACDCNIVDDVRDQHFTGWRKENERVGTTNYGALWRAAVDATISGSSAQVLTYKGSPISTYYYSSSGGATANSEDVWASAIDYLKSVPDDASLNAPGNSMKSWQRTVTAASMASLFGLPNIATIEVTERYSSGQVKQMRATAANGATATYTAKADVVRSKLGSLPAAWVSSFTPVL